MANMTITGQRIKQRREALNISAKELSERIGVNKSTVYHYENGDFESIKMGTIELIAAVLQVNPQWLTGKSEIMTPVENQLSVDKRDIVYILDETIKMIQRPDVTLDGKPVDNRSIQILTDSILIGLELARKNKMKS